jgi:hypothetical protein
MLRDRLSPWTRAAVALLLAGSVLSCSGEDIVFPGDDDDDDDATVTFAGTLDDVTPVSTRDIVVFVYNVDDEPDGLICVGGPTPGIPCVDDGDCGDEGDEGECDDGLCPCPGYPRDLTDGKATVIESGDLEFTVSGIENGAIKIVFLLDNPGDDADGQIDDGDPIAILDDVDCEIDDVDGDLTVTLHDVDINFAADPVVDCEDGDPPAEGRARADLITQERTDDGDNPGDNAGED